MSKYSARRDPKVVGKVMRLARQGKSCREIAKAIGFSRQTVSLIAKDKGHQWGVVNTKRADEARRAYSAERRAGQVLALAEKLDGVIGRIDSAYTVFGFGGKDNVFNSEQLERPDAKATNELASACYRITATMKQLHDFESGSDESMSAVDEWLMALRTGTGTQ